MALNLIILDGADYNLIHKNLDMLPCFKRLHKRYGVDLLMCDVFPTTVASTSTIFTGKEPDIKGFCKPDTGHMTTLENLKGPPLWETLKDKMNVKILLAYVTLPPVNIGFAKFTHLKRRTRKWLPTSEEEIDIHTKYVLEGTLKTLVEPEPKFFSATFHTLDTAAHLFKTPGERDMYSTSHKFLEHYKQAHEWLNPMLLLLEKSDFMIVSDHGLPAYYSPSALIRGAPRHHPNGICITNQKHKPGKISEVHQAILKNTLLTEVNPYALERM